MTAAQEIELARRMAAFDLERDDLAWAKPYVNEALAEAERGEVISLEDHDAHIDALMAKLGD